MKYKFAYFPPPTGPLSGKSFKEQTENAFNDIGQIAYDAADVGKDALAGANMALAEAGNALEKANEAISTANRALGTGETAGQTADVAIKNAQNAQKTADAASAKADGAIEKADEAQATADQALARGDEANVIASANSTKINIVNVMAELARDTSEQALNAARTGIYYKPMDEAVDLDEMLDSVSLLIHNPTSSNLPVAEKSYLTVRIDEDDTGVIQTVQTHNNVIYTRTGTITASSKINPGIDTISVIYQSSDTVPYEVDIKSKETPGDLSVTRFTGKSHAISEASPTGLKGQFIVEQDAFNDGSLTVNSIPLADISLGNITLTHNRVVTEHGVITATHALLDGRSLELTLSFEWTDIEIVSEGHFTDWSRLATQSGGGEGEGAALNNLSNVTACPDFRGYESCTETTDPDIHLDEDSPNHLHLKTAGNVFVTAVPLANEISKEITISTTADSSTAIHWPATIQWASKSPPEWGAPAQTLVVVLWFVGGLIIGSTIFNSEK